MQAIDVNRWRSKVAFFLAMGLIVLGAARIVATHSVFSQTSDEPFHIAAGMEWLDKGVYNYEAQHPPLARVAAAIGPYLLGSRSQGKPDARSEGKAILLGGSPLLNLSAARLGILPFFVVSALVVWAWARELGGDGAALASVLFFTTLPAALAHSGLATNDAAVMAFVTAGLWTWTRWLAAPSRMRAALVGLTWALAVLSKLSALLYLPVGAFATLVVWAWAFRRSAGSAHRPAWTTFVKHGLLAAVVGFAVVWSAYRFSVAFPPALGGAVPVPAPELWRGVRALFAHNEAGHLAYLFGETSQNGWWYFFPVAIGVKTPLPFLLLIGVGAGACLWQAYRDGRWALAAPVAIALAILLAVIPINLNIGLRYILPVYPLFAVVAGLGTAMVWNQLAARLVARAAIVALLAWLVVDTTRAHPDYLAYFNETARQEPHRILVDSDLDWGQDFYRLVAEVERRRIDAIAVAFWGSVDLDRQGTPGMRRLQPHERPVGWVAASDLYRSGLADPGYAWLAQEVPVTRIGKTIWLYRFAPAAPPR